jgi:hypothetical protein
MSHYEADSKKLSASFLARTWMQYVAPKCLLTRQITQHYSPNDRSPERTRNLKHVLPFNAYALVLYQHFGITAKVPISGI